MSPLCCILVCGLIVAFPGHTNLLFHLGLHFLLESQIYKWLREHNEGKLHDIYLNWVTGPGDNG